MHDERTLDDEVEYLRSIPVPEIPNESGMPSEFLSIGCRPQIKGEPERNWHRRMAGERIRYIKSYHKVTKAAMAACAGISDQCFNEAYQGRSILSDEPCIKLARRYEVTVPYLKGLPVSLVKRQQGRSSSEVSDISQKSFDPPENNS